MKDISVVPARPVQILDPVDGGPIDELQDPLVTVQEDELPQGVLELMVALIRQQRSTMDTAQAVMGHSMNIAQGAVNVEHDEARSIVPARTDVEPDRARPTARNTKSFPHAGLLFDTAIQQALPQRLEPVASVRDPLAAPTFPASIEPMALDPFTIPEARPIPRFDESLPQAPQSLQGTRHAPRVAAASIPSPATSAALPMPEVMVEPLSCTDRGLLQVPFNRGAVSGQVTISRMPEETTRQLTLSPSNALVFEQLKAPFELAREPAWRLADSDGEQQRQGSQQRPDEDQDEQSGSGA
ncbi:type III secretion effector protein [Pseudomonas sp. St316]|uniref:SpaN/EivJ family type III secretion system needle length determinant n=1 Tax=Pseudomonas sp. St316 TaxID=2678257 RepID=UPI001BB35214|nr:type III secretion effector protein [Pseudomonas sp. St316]BBP60586.1 hypothetical protein PHLH4_41760 [Pseudomonas sp. St316]